jgi:hypothetical protein
VSGEHNDAAGVRSAIIGGLEGTTTHRRSVVVGGVGASDSTDNDVVAD